MPDFSPGLEGVVAAETEVSEVDGANGRLIYRWTPAKGDTGNILGGLGSVNTSLKNICAKIAVPNRPCN